METVIQKVQHFFNNKYREAGILLNDVQQQAVVHTDGPLLLLAVPGSGKTTTLMMKIGYLIEEKGIKPKKIKALTFSRAAASDMQQRFKQLFPVLEAPSFSTIHSFAFEVARAYMHKQRITYYLIEGDKTEQKHQAAGEDHDAIPHKQHILRQLYHRLIGDTLSDEQMDELTTYISYVKNKMLSQSQWSLAECSVPQADTILQHYEQYKREFARGLLLDFDDMLVIANEALQEDEQLLGMVQQRYDYVLTDESQDTSLVQHHIIAKLVERHRNLCVVADDDQSIYSWRGAEPAYLLQFKEAYPEAMILYMEQNYRSTGTIVQAAATFITRNKQRYPKRMFTDNELGEPIQFHHVANPTEQTKYVIEQVSSSTHLSDIAVLYRNNASSITLMNALDRAGIPYYIKDADLRFFSHWVVEDVLNFMRMSFTDKRVDILEKIHLKLNGYISKQQMNALKSIQNDESVFDNLINYVELNSYQVELLLSSKETFQQMKGMPPLPAIRVIRERLGYDRALEKICDRLGFRKEYLFNILNTLEEIAADLTTMEQFASRLKHLDSTMKQSTRRRGDQAVTLSTLHSAKGLEFEKVFIIDLLEGILPSAHDKRVEQLEEAGRLFYVGITRAKRQLQLITYAARGGEKASESRFVADVRNILHPPQQQASAGSNGGQAGRTSINGSSSISRTIGTTTSTSISKGVNGSAKGLTVTTPPMSRLHPNAITSKSQLRTNMKIKHIKFGAGEILELDEERVLIEFAGGTKRLALAACLDSGLLLKEELEK